MVSVKSYSAEKLHETHLCEFLWDFKMKEIKHIR